MPILFALTQFLYLYDELHIIFFNSEISMQSNTLILLPRAFIEI
jgi:hypothetical protein